MNKAMIKYCKCGCGEETHRGNRFINGHHNRTKSKESRKKMSESHKGLKPSKETRKKLSEASMGHEVSSKTRKKISKARKGIPLSAEHCKKLSLAHVGVQAGSKHPNWQGGYSKGDYGLEFNKQLREEVRRRDNYTCQCCGITERRLKNKRFKKLDVHHIDYNKKNNKKENLISLCKSCHMKTGFDRHLWEEYFDKQFNLAKAYKRFSAIPIPRT